MICIKDKISSIINPKFSFNFVSFDRPQIRKDKLNPKKASQTTDTPVSIIKRNKDVLALFIYHNFNNSLSGSSFPTVLKYADIRPVFKKDDKTDKEN